MRPSKVRNQGGFTIIELMVVVAILGILASIALMKYQEAAASARGTKILADLRTIDSAISVAQTSKGIIVPNGSVTAVLPAELIPEILAAGPKPTAGPAVINGGSLFTVPDGTAYAVTSSRATINNKTIEQVLADKSI